MCKNKICGIYRITSPSGRIYIGESKNIKNRWRAYKRLDCKGQVKLYKSFYKYGVVNHIFEIIEECSLENLLCRERHWQDFYDVLKKGLNCKLTECGEQKQIHSQETIEKMRLSSLGELNPMYGKKQSEESIRLRVLQVLGENHYLYGKSPSIESVEKANKTKKKLKIQVRGNNIKAKLVLCLETGVFYDCAVDAAEAYNINCKYLQAMLRGAKKNKTSLIYL